MVTKMPGKKVGIVWVEGPGLGVKLPSSGDITVGVASKHPLEGCESWLPGSLWCRSGGQI